MSELKIKLCFLSEFLFTVKVNDEEKEIDNETCSVAFELPGDADYEVEIIQKRPPGKHKLLHIVLSVVLWLVLLVIMIILQDGMDNDWYEDIQPFLLRAKIKGNMREHRELNLYYYKSRNINGDYTKPRLVCDEIAPYEISYEVNRADIKSKFHGFARTVAINTVLLAALFLIMLAGGLIAPVNTALVVVSAVCLAATLVVCAVSLISKYRKWYKYIMPDKKGAAM